MSVTYYVALSFVDSEEGRIPAEAMECPNEGAAVTETDLAFPKYAHA
jgi:hypothetical protein